jgi:ABC-2 type transport system ATP-binding protein
MPDIAQIRMEHLVVQYGRFTAVNDLTLSVAAGELFGFLGPNGAGKSTTIKVLIGVCQPTAGVVEVAGFRIPGQLNRIKPLFGYVPDTENHIEEFTGRENLNLFADLYSIKRDAVKTALRRLELEEAADLPVRNYSKGMRRKLLIAREIMHQPKILYLDEPTANLDAHSTQVVRRLLRELASSGVTVFMTTHDMEEVEAICDRVAILAKGRLIECDTPANFVVRHAERKVEIQFELEGEMFREVLNLDQPAERDRLAMLIQTRHCSRLHTQEFHFEDVFLKLTGQVYA